MKTPTDILKDARSADFNGTTYYVISDIADQLPAVKREWATEPLKPISLPFDGEQLECTNESNAHYMIKVLSQQAKDENGGGFDATLKQALNYDPKK